MDPLVTKEDITKDVTGTAKTNGDKATRRVCSYGISDASAATSLQRPLMSYSELEFL